jgi:hypothetical protein
MPFYSVLIEGKNLRIPADKDGPGIAGFFTTRIVHATSHVGAEDEALRSVRNGWEKPEDKSQPGAEDLALAVSKTDKSGLLEWFRAPNKGHTFFSEES